MNDKLRAALQSVVDDCENCDWTCERCGKDYGMTETDLYSAAKKALSDPAPAEQVGEQAKAETIARRRFSSRAKVATTAGTVFSHCGSAGACACQWRT